MVHQSICSESSCYSDLEVVPGKGLKTVHIGLEAVSFRSVTTKVEPVDNVEECGDGKNSGSVCGLRLRTFWIVLVVGTIVIAAAVGAAIVGSLLQKRVIPGSVYVAQLAHTTSHS